MPLPGSGAPRAGSPSASTTALPSPDRLALVNGVPHGDDEALRALHEHLAPTPAALALVHTHCLIVAAVAAQLLARIPQDLDPALVHVGCVLHDVGVYRLYDAHERIDRANYLRHGILGEQLLRERGYPDVLGRFCSHHT